MKEAVHEPRQPEGSCSRARDLTWVHGSGSTERTTGQPGNSLECRLIGMKGKKIDPSVGLPCQHLDFGPVKLLGLPTSIIVRELMCTILSH